MLLQVDKDYLWLSRGPRIELTRAHTAVEINFSSGIAKKQQKSVSITKIPIKYPLKNKHSLSSSTTLWISIRLSLSSLRPIHSAAKKAGNPWAQLKPENGLSPWTWAETLRCENREQHAKKTKAAALETTFLPHVLNSLSQRRGFYPLPPLYWTESGPTPERTYMCRLRWTLSSSSVLHPSTGRFVKWTSFKSDKSLMSNKIREEQNARQDLITVDKKLKTPIPRWR